MLAGLQGCTGRLPVGRADVLCTQGSVPAGDIPTATPGLWRASQCPPGGLSPRPGQSRAQQGRDRREAALCIPAPRAAGSIAAATTRPTLLEEPPSSDPCRPHIGHNWCPDRPPPSTHGLPWPRPQESLYACRLCTKPAALPPQRKSRKVCSRPKSVTPKIHMLSPNPPRGWYVEAEPLGGDGVIRVRGRVRSGEPLAPSSV